MVKIICHIKFYNLLISGWTFSSCEFCLNYLYLLIILRKCPRCVNFCCWFLKVAFKAQSIVRSIWTQGRFESNCCNQSDWVTEYRVQFSQDGVSWQKYKDQSGNDLVSHYSYHYYRINWWKYHFFVRIKKQFENSVIFIFIWRCKWGWFRFALYLSFDFSTIPKYVGRKISW